MIRITTCLILLCLFTSQGFAAGKTAALKDDFKDPKLKERSTLRGDWKIADGVARCTQDDELYKKNKDHGPIIWYKVPLDDATIHFSYKAEKLKTFVFTLNGEKSHVFRFVTSDAGTTIVTFPPENEDHKSLPLKREGPKMKSGEWTDVTVDVRGPKATVKIGKDYTVTVEHPAIVQSKIAVGLAFSFGTIEVKEFSITP